jgi:peptide subunit release factor 1 (eRF1)
MSSARNPVSTEDLLIDRLSKLEAKAPIIVSCYLKVDPETRRNRAYLVEFLHRVKALDATLDARGVDPASRRKIAADVERIARWLARPGKPPALPGIAIFAAKDLDLFETIPLARVHRNRIDVDTRPLLRELVDARETLGHYLSVVVDRERARFFHVTAAHTDEITDLIAVAHRGGKFTTDRQDAPGWGEHRFNQRAEEEKHRHFLAVTAEIGRLVQARPYRGIALFGPEMHTTALEEFLPERLRRIAIGTGKLNPKSVTPAQVARFTWSLQRAAERRDEAALLDRLDDAMGSGLAVNGVKETLMALSRGQVRELIVPEGPTAAGFRCASGELTPAKSQCRDGKEATPIAHLVDEAIEDALSQRVEVVVIDDPRTAARVDGLAGLLRFREDHGGTVAAEPVKAGT